MIPFIIIAAIVVAGVAIIYAEHCIANRTWRRCISCKRYFSSIGDISDTLPQFTEAHDGVCPDCVMETEFRL
jgi:hypothetical protein